MVIRKVNLRDKEKILNSLIDEARKLWESGDWIDTQKLLDFTEKLSKEKRSDE